MAIDPSVEFPGKIDNTAPADYPYGKARNITTPGDGTGTPFVANLLNDLFGMQQALLDLAGLTPSGVPDTVQASQYLEALKVVAPRGYFFDDVVGAGTFTPPVGVTRVKVTVMGGGGGGGTAEQITADGPARPGGGGGGGGGVGVTWLEMPDPFNPIEIGYTIGQGGAEGATGDQSEALRNDTTGTLVLAQGEGRANPPPISDHSTDVARRAVKPPPPLGRRVRQARAEPSAPRTLRLHSRGRWVLGAKAGRSCAGAAAPERSALSE